MPQIGLHLTHYSDDCLEYWQDQEGIQAFQMILCEISIRSLNWGNIK